MDMDFCVGDLRSVSTHVCMNRQQHKEWNPDECFFLGIPEKVLPDW